LIKHLQGLILFAKVTTSTAKRKRIMCGIDNQIAKHCDDDEIYCSECGGIMTYDNVFDLVCDECGYVREITHDDF